MTTRLRFWRKVSIPAGDECWEWTAATGRKGYGQFSVGAGRHAGAHRVAWELVHGPIPEGLCVCHHCDNPPCVRPSHLFLGTVTDNNRDMVSKGRHVSGFVVVGPTRGEQRPGAKLSDAAVRDARLRYSHGERVPPLAREYGVSVRNMYNALRGDTWRHVASIEELAEGRLREGCFVCGANLRLVEMESRRCERCLRAEDETPMETAYRSRP